MGGGGGGGGNGWMDGIIERCRKNRIQEKKKVERLTRKTSKKHKHKSSRSEEGSMS